MAIDNIYLVLKRKITILVQDNWALFPGDMLVFEKIGTRTIEKLSMHSSSTYITTPSYRLNYFEYENIKDFHTGETILTVNKCNSIDPKFKVSLPNYSQTDWSTYDEMILSGGVGIYTIDEIFEDVSIKYNREEKLKKILNG